MFNVKRRNSQFLYEDYNLAIIPVAYELPERAELIKVETKSNFLIDFDKNNIKCKMEKIVSLLVFRKYIRVVNIHLKKLLILLVLVLLTIIVI